MAKRKKRKKKKLLTRVIVKRNGTMISPVTRKSVKWSQISSTAKFQHEK